MTINSTSLLSECRIMEDNELNLDYHSQGYILELTKNSLIVYDYNDVIRRELLNNDNLLKSHKLQRMKCKIASRNIYPN